MTSAKRIPAVSFQTARSGASTNANELGMRPMQERAYNKRGEQYLLIKSPPASGTQTEWIRPKDHRDPSFADNGLAASGYFMTPERFLVLFKEALPYP